MSLLGRQHSVSVKPPAGRLHWELAGKDLIIGEKKTSDLPLLAAPLRWLAGFTAATFSILKPISSCRKL